MNRFYVTNQQNSLAVANILVELGYEEIDCTILGDNDKLPLLLIDRALNSFFFLDDGALVLAEPIIFNLLREKIYHIDSHTAQLWRD